MESNPLLLWIVLLPFAAALVAPILYRMLRGATGLVLALIPLFILVIDISHAPFAIGEAAEIRLPWIPTLGVELAFRMDGFSALFVLLISGIGALITLYASGYLAGDPRLGRFYAYLYAFMGAMLGVVLSDDLILLFVFWELTSVCSYLLIGYYHETETARDAALKALLVTATGGLALLAGVLLLGSIHAALGATGSEVWRISTLLKADIRSHALYPLALILILLGAFTKSAQFPFHFWLPSAMAGPTPVSAFLHSATMVKAGIYLMARLTPALGDTDLWHAIVGGGGAITMVLTAVLAACQTDLKRILAFSTLSVLGALTMLIGIGTDKAIKAMLVLLAAHALYKAALFMVAGNIDHETGTRDVTRLGGLRRLMPFTAIAGIIAALSNAGAPPMFGFVGKEMVYAAKLSLDSLSTLAITLAVLANIFLTATALIVAVWPFFGPRGDTPKHPHEAPAVMLIGPVLLAGVSLMVGLISPFFELNLGSASASAIVGRPLEMYVKLWHGFHPEALMALGLSVVTIGAGLLVFLRMRGWIIHLQDVARRLDATWGLNAQYDKFLPGLIDSSHTLMRHIQTGYLRHYLLVILLATVGLILVPVLRGVSIPWNAAAWSIYWHEAALGALILGGAIAAAVSRSRLAAVAALGGTGFGVSMLFLMFSAPDLAMTQIMVEILAVILLVMVFLRLPPYAAQSSAATRSRDLLISLAVGALMMLLVLTASDVQLPADVARYLAENSQPAAYGRNIVNVILVDFRGMDTMGEITVVAVAGVGVFAMLRHALRKRKKDTA